MSMMCSCDGGDVPLVAVARAGKVTVANARCVRGTRAALYTPLGDHAAMRCVLCGVHCPIDGRARVGVQVQGYTLKVPLAHAHPIQSPLSDTPHADAPLTGMARSSLNCLWKPALLLWLSTRKVRWACRRLCLRMSIDSTCP